MILCLKVSLNTKLLNLNKNDNIQTNEILQSDQVKPILHYVAEKAGMEGLDKAKIEK